jgi:hypothetical protein
MKIVEEEAGESLVWLTRLETAGIPKALQRSSLVARR